MPCLVIPAPLFAQDVPEVALAEALVIPARTEVVLRVDVEISSKTAKRGDKFPLTLVSDIRVGDYLLVPAGATGEGEVIHSVGKGFGGSAGELLLAARYLNIGASKLKLQSFKIAKTGANNSAEAIVATNLFLPAGLFVTGSSAVVPAGQVAAAKTAEAFSMPANEAAISELQPEEQD